jgi:hypothetical protein
VQVVPFISEFIVFVIDARRVPAGVTAAFVIGCCTYRKSLRAPLARRKRKNTDWIC